MITSSKLELARKCPGAFTLPHVDTPNDYTKAGDERHADDEDAINSGEVPAKLADAFPGYTWRAEVAYGYDVSTGEGREIGVGIKRAYPNLGPFWVFGTVDAEGIGPNGELAVVDKKGFDDITAAEAHPQVRFLGLAAARTKGMDRVEVALTHEIRSIDRAVMEAFDLDEEAMRVRNTLLDVAKVREAARSGAEVPFNQGRQCRWCPVPFELCPKQRELVSLVQTDAAFNEAEMRMPFRDDADAADAFDLWKRIGVLHKRIGAALFARASERPIPLHNGKMFGPQSTLGNEKLDGDITYEVLRARHGQAIADAAVERHATKKKLREALDFVGAKGQVAALERAVLEEVKQKGGIDRKRKVEIVEYAPQLQAVNE